MALSIPSNHETYNIDSSSDDSSQKGKDSRTQWQVQARYAHDPFPQGIGHPSFILKGVL